MASPFRVFRKNVKPLLVVFGCLLIIAWVGGSSLTSIMSGDGGGSRKRARDINAVAASWEGGSLTNRELDELVMRRQVTNGFLEQVEGLGAQSAYMAGIEPPELRVQRLMGPETREQGVEQSVLRTKLFADAAKEAGMHVSDEAVVQYLDELGRGRVTREDMRGILQRLQSSGMGVTIDYVINALRDEILARNYFTSNMYAFQTVTPEERWKDWLSANDRIVVEAAAVPVESSLVDVKEPTEADLVAFFDEYKNRENAPELVDDLELPSAKPGFRMPRKVDIQYLQADFTELVTKAEAEITDEEIAKHYEENKELFIKADTELLEDDSATQSAEPADGATADPQDPASESATETESPTDPAASGEEPATTPPVGEPAESTNPADVPAADNPAPQSDPATPAEPAASTNESKDEEKAAPADNDQSSRKKATGVFRQVAFFQDSETDTPAAEDATESKEAAPPTDQKAAPPASEAPAAPATDAPAASAPENPAADATAAPATPEKPKEYQPLEEVRDLIRRDLAYRRVSENLTSKMDGILGELTSTFTAYLGEVLDAQSKKEKAPAPPAELANLQPIAEKNGLTYAKTGPIPWLEFRNTPVGKSGNPDTGMPLSSTIFGSKDLELFQPVLTVDIDSNRFISMKTSDTPGRVPKLKEVKDEVVRAWKLQKAAEIALKDAQAEAKKAQEAGSPLADYFADDKSIEVVSVDPFSQLTRGDVPDQMGRQRFRLSQPDGLVAPGPEFMRTIFKLKNGEVTAVLNHDHSIAYIVRMVEHVKPDDELRTAYLAEANTWDGRPTMAGNRAMFAQQLLAADLSGVKGVDWKRTPDQTENEAEAEAE